MEAMAALRFPSSISSRNLGACTDKCTVIEDVSNGWEGYCLGLQLMNLSTTADVCRDNCCDDSKCEVWQWGNMRDIASVDGLGICYAGKGLECSGDRFDDFLVLAGQKISHGSVRKAEKLEPGTWCTGSNMRQATNLTLNANSESIQECRQVCYNDATCSLWEFSSTDGCWLGHSDSCSSASPGAATMVAGQHVEHECGSSGEEQKYADTDYVMVFGIIGVVAFLLTCCGTVFLVCCHSLREPLTNKGKGKKRHKRRVENELLKQERARDPGLYASESGSEVNGASQAGFARNAGGANGYMEVDQVSLSISSRAGAEACRRTGTDSEAPWHSRHQRQAQPQSGVSNGSAPASSFNSLSWVPQHVAAAGNHLPGHLAGHAATVGNGHVGPGFPQQMSGSERSLGSNGSRLRSPLEMSTNGNGFPPQYQVRYR